MRWGCYLEQEDIIISIVAVLFIYFWNLFCNNGVWKQSNHCHVGGKVIE